MCALWWSRGVKREHNMMTEAGIPEGLPGSSWPPFLLRLQVGEWRGRCCSRVEESVLKWGTILCIRVCVLCGESVCLPESSFLSCPTVGEALSGGNSPALGIWRSWRYLPVTPELCKTVSGQQQARANTQLQKTATN